MIALAFWALALAGQARTPPVSPPTPAVIVRGVVLDARTKAPIADAQVTLVDLNRDVRTGRDGRFEIRDVAAGTHMLTVSTVGYIFVRRELTVASAPIDLTLPLSEGTGAYQENGAGWGTLHFTSTPSGAFAMNADGTFYGLQARQTGVDYGSPQ